ncbi:MAG: hypothetical protein KGZ68_04380 [Dechloromonas sp.]|nr:hypothetical protein [Dechloromonas sp.]
MATVTASTPLVGVTGSYAGINYSGTFIPTLWSGKFNAKFYATTVFGDIANTDWQGEISGLGDKVVIQNVPDIGIADYTIGSTLTYVPVTPGTIEMQIDRAKSFNFPIHDVLVAQSKPNQMEMFSNDASMQMKIAIDRDILVGTSTRQGVWNAVAAANQGATAGVLSGAYNLGTAAAPIALSSAGAALDTILKMAAVLDEQNVPEEGRWLLIDPATRQALMNTNLANALQMGDDKSMVRNGKVGMIDRFQVYVSNLLPRAAATQDYFGAAAAGTAKRRLILAGHKSAITFASQLVKTESIRNPNDFGDLVRGLNVYGYKVVKDTALTSALVA